MTLGITAEDHEYWRINAQTTSKQKGLLNVINRESRSSDIYRTKEIYLAEGDLSGGLQHIMERHGGDFLRKFGANGKQAVADKYATLSCKVIGVLMASSKTLQEEVLLFAIKLMKEAIFK